MKSQPEQMGRLEKSEEKGSVEDEEVLVNNKMDGDRWVRR